MNGLSLLSNIHKYSDHIRGKLHKFRRKENRCVQNTKLMSTTLWPVLATCSVRRWEHQNIGDVPFAENSEPIRIHPFARSIRPTHPRVRSIRPRHEDQYSTPSIF